MENIWNFLICFIVIEAKLQTYVHAKARFQIDGTGMECSTDSPLVANKSCKMTCTDESKQFYNIDVYFKDGVEINELDLVLLLFSFALFGMSQLQFTWMYKTNNDIKYRPVLGLSNLTVDLCHYLINGNSMLVDLFLDDVKKHSNVVHKCPFKGHCYVKGLGANVKKFPAIIPNGEYYMIMLFYTKLNELEHILLNLKLSANVRTVNFG